MKTLRSISALAAVCALPLFAHAQTLPPSTIDRQQIANLTYQANLPGTSAAERAAIQRQITELQYQINTRPPIQPMPVASPSWNGSFTTLQTLPRVNPNASPVPLSPTVYGSCDADRAVLAYLNEQLQQPSQTAVERDYTVNRRNEIQHDLRTRGC